MQLLQALPALEWPMHHCTMQPLQALQGPMHHQQQVQQQ
jgi:hypothetical protein